MKMTQDNNSVHNTYKRLIDKTRQLDLSAQ